MRSLSRSAIGVLFLAALAPLPGAAADAVHPLNPAASAGVVSTRNIFEDAVPLLNRENPLPSFTAEGEETMGAPADASPPQESESMNHDARGHGTPQAATE
jgi:hypothetical protein